MVFSNKTDYQPIFQNCSTFARRILAWTPRLTQPKKTWQVIDAGYTIRGGVVV